MEEEKRDRERGRQDMNFVGDEKGRIIVKYSYHRSFKEPAGDAALEKQETSA
jgi:hypothetical protein